jgi:hypothetical protein
MEGAMAMRRLLVAAVSAMVVAGCASTRIRSQVDPQVRGHAYRKVMVFVDFRDMDLRQDTERQFVAALASHGALAASSMDLLPPDREYSTEEETQILLDAGIDAVLVVTPAGAGWIPQRRITPGRAPVMGNTVSGSARTRTYIEPSAQFEAALRDRQSNNIVWMARMSSSSKAFAGWGTLARAMARSMAKKTSDQLVRDQVVQ